MSLDRGVLSGPDPKPFWPEGEILSVHGSDINTNCRGSLFVSMSRRVGMIDTSQRSQLDNRAEFDYLLSIKRFGRVISAVLRNRREDSQTEETA
jgi:hypothetical protein